MRRTLLALILAAAVSASAFATVVVRVGVDDLTDTCHRAVVGTVESTSVEFDREKGRIWTTYRIRVDETWLGGADAAVVVSVPGGESGGVTQDYEGGARLEKGARAALFLWRRDDGRLLVLGEGQGAFHVRRDAASGADVCENAVDGLVLMDRTGKRVDGAPLRMTLDDLRARVTAAKAAREERERAAKEAYERKMAELRKRAERSAELSRGKPGGAPEK